MKDSVGSTDGMLFGSGLRWNPTGGHDGGALSFPGGNAFVRLGTPALLSNLPEVTVSAWLFPTSVTFDGLAHCFFDKGTTDSPAPGGWNAGVGTQTDGDVSFQVFYAPGDELTVTSAPVLGVGRWQHVVTTWDGSSRSASTSFTGLEDDVKIYDRVLTATQVARL